jgi:hypothetical protein
MTTHVLKCWPAYFGPVAEGLKTWEYRKDDRPYAVGDVLCLREWDPEVFEVCVAERLGHLTAEEYEELVVEASHYAYTGRVCERCVTYLARGGVIPAGYVVMSLEIEVQP